MGLGPFSGLQGTFRALLLHTTQEPVGRVCAVLVPTPCYE